MLLVALVCATGIYFEEDDVTRHIVETVEKAQDFSERARGFFEALGSNWYFQIIESVRQWAADQREAYLDDHADVLKDHANRVRATRAQWYYERMKDTE